jgi:hypothetical protein
LFLLLLACTATSPERTDTGIDFEPQMPKSECGLPNYNWLTTGSMGELTASTLKPDLSLGVDTIKVLLENYSLPLPTPTNSVDTYYVQYRSQDRGMEALGTAIISLPRELDNAPVLLWLHPSMGFADECAPSAIGILGAAYPMLFASMGFIVVAPDYLGMSGWIGNSDELHPYIIGEPAAVFSIDALRSLPNLIVEHNIDIDFDPEKISIWGVSEGGYAALFTDRYLPHYAPEFSSVATVATVPGTDPFALAQHGLTEFGPTTMATIAVQTTAQQWYQSTYGVEDYLQPEIADAIFDELYNSCSDFSILDGIEEVEEIFTMEYIDGVLSDDGTAEHWACMLKENSLTTSPVLPVDVAPTLIVTSELDDLAIPTIVHEDIPKLCEQGYNIQHLQCADASHVSGAVDSIGTQWSWILARLDGVEISDECVVQEPTLCEAD